MAKTHSNTSTHSGIRSHSAMLTPPELLSRAVLQTTLSFAESSLTCAKQSYSSFFCVLYGDNSRDAISSFWPASLAHWSLSPHLICHIDIETQNNVVCMVRTWTWWSWWSIPGDTITSEVLQYITNIPMGSPPNIYHCPVFCNLWLSSHADPQGWALTVSKLPLCIRSMGGLKRSASVVSFLSTAPPLRSSCSCRTARPQEERTAVRHTHTHQGHSALLNAHTQSCWGETLSRS